MRWEDSGRGCGGNWEERGERGRKLGFKTTFWGGGYVDYINELNHPLSPPLKPPPKTYPHHPTTPPA